VSGPCIDAPLSAMLLAGVSALCSFAMCFLAVVYGPLDAPDGDRKTQMRPVATSGGLGVLGAVLLVLVLASLIGRDTPSAPITVPGLVLVAGATLVGVIDDVTQLRASLKLALLGGLSLMAAGLGSSAETIHGPFGGQLDLSPSFAVMGTALFLFVTMNAVNFMDGANGLAAGSMVPASLALGWIARAEADPLTALMLALSGALIGFLVWNLRGRLYLGDSGALGIGALLGVVAIQVQTDVRPGGTGPGVWFCATLLLAFFVDVFLTLAWRARQRQALLNAHREHAYQRLLRAGWSHWRVSLVWWAIAVTSAIVGVGAVEFGPPASFWAFWVLVGVGAVVWTYHRRHLPVRLNKAG